MIVLKYPREGATVSLQSETQRAFLADEPRRRARDGGLTFRWYDLKREEKDSTQPLPVLFSWEERLQDGEEAAKGALYCLLVSESPDMTGAAAYMTEEGSLAVYNLKVATRYFWCVRKNGKQSAVFSFTTEAALPRCMWIDAISNVRDMGGYAVEGGRIRQGLLYRGGEFELHGHLTKQGAEALCRLGIRTELDMRGEAIGKVDFTAAEPLGISRILVPCVPYTQVFKKENADNVRAFFEVLADPLHYPIYFHCWGGADRTGTFALILGAFLGMNETQLIDDYEFTSLSVWGTRTRNYGEFRCFWEALMALSGKTLRQKADTFLQDIAGLSFAQREAIYRTLVEPDM